MKYMAITRVKPGMILAQSIIGISKTEKYVVGTALSADDIEYLSEKGLFGLYVFDDIPNEILSPSLLSRCIEHVNGLNIEELIPLSKDIVVELTTKPINLDFRSVRSFDDYIAHHSVCVAVYAVALGIQMKMSNVELFDLALAGLLHDVGQKMFDQSLLSKMGKLSLDEYEIIKRHPEEGYKFIMNNELISDEVKNAVRYHHENTNGTGYPEKLTGKNIPLLARIIHVVDVYDAIMSKRPYKLGLSSCEAINYLIGGKTILFDEKIVDEFVKIAVPYPTGSEIRLSNKEVGLVIKQSADSFRPIIRLEGANRIVDLMNDVEYTDITIQCDIDYEFANIVDITSGDNTVSVASSDKPKILIVDDVFVSIAYTKISLGLNYEVVTCMGGALAAKTVREERPDLILMDYDMPDLNGVEAVNEIRKLGFTTPVIFLTGKSDEETVMECIRCGAIDYVLKPANSVYLRTRVAMALENIDGNIFL